MVVLEIETTVELARSGADHRAVGTVLVVDDSRAQRVVLCRMLARWGYKVREADSGSAALKSCEQDPPDLVLSDWMMPGMSGLEFCREFRKMARIRYGYFILLTSKCEKDDITRGFDAGADDFLTKPVNGAELRARITAGERILAMERELSEKNRLISSTLDELRKIHDSINIDLIEARKLQQSLVSERHRDFGPAEVSLLLRSSGHVGGDLVGMFPAGDTCVGVYGIDVSGHGISSALMTARLAGYLSATAPDQNIALVKATNGAYRARCPAETVGILNELVLGEIETEHYFTLALADIDLKSGRVRIAQAGHPCPLVQRASGAVDMVGSGGLPVGLIKSAEFQPFEIQLEPGDRFLIHSDGITECTNSDGRLFGDIGLRSTMQKLTKLRGLACLEALVGDLSSFLRRQDFDDDVSAALLEFKGPT